MDIITELSTINTRMSIVLTSINLQFTKLQLDDLKKSKQFQAAKQAGINTANNIKNPVNKVGTNDNNKGMPSILQQLKEQLNKSLYTIKQLQNDNQQLQNDNQQLQN